MTTPRTASPTDVSDEEWAFVAPYLTLLPEDAGQHHYDLREVFNGLRYTSSSEHAPLPISSALANITAVLQPRLKRRR